MSFPMSFHEIEWYDRNPNSLGDNYTLDLAPHAETERLRYECPAEKMAMVELLQAKVMRMIAAEVAGLAYACWKFQKSGETEQMILHSWIIENVVGTKDTSQVGTTVTLSEGDEIIGYTRDGSTGGVVRYFLSYKITEFDAYLYHATPKTRPAPLVNVQEAKPRPDPVM